VADTSDQRWFRLSVSNFGFGIKEEWKELVFREGWRIPWWEIPDHQRVDRGDKQLYRSGTGIGCAVIKRVMEAHGGKVTVESHKGHGPQKDPVGFRFWSGCKTTFTVEFPRK
jgi:signal transduction histidine kinase